MGDVEEVVCSEGLGRGKLGEMEDDDDSGWKKDGPFPRVGRRVRGGVGVERISADSTLDSTRGGDCSGLLSHQSIFHLPIHMVAIR